MHIKKIILALLLTVTVFTAINSVAPTTADAAVTVHRMKVVHYAEKFIGTPYVLGGMSRRSFDCSGLVAYTFEHAAHIYLPHKAARQARMVKHIKRSNVKAGDLLFWSHYGYVYHVAIAISHAQFIQAPEPGGRVEISTISQWHPSFVGRVRHHAYVY
ncbi:NlpC/P60 family protein [Periweissella cryptocerci]|uniref:NlpC/P60 family protein n=1 Tax=Periweissella cryptocerci TaxID=2506420 RepID=A0A4P6YQT1_9LACO|nr:C40 family peptidase [Periweissella cryptocerci]QBO34946.1 NlpC/P60 family protein [Periweissella cryptocerci]